MFLARAMLSCGGCVRAASAGATCERLDGAALAFRRVAPRQGPEFHSEVAAVMIDSLWGVAVYGLSQFLVFASTSVVVAVITVVTFWAEFKGEAL